MEYKTLETGNSSKHNNQNNLPMEYKILETGNSSKHNNQNNYQWNQKTTTTIKTTTNGI